MDKSRDHDFPR